jgi:hypothetical protein
VYEGNFFYGRPHGLIRISFAAGRVAFAMYRNGEREGWIKGDRLHDLEEAWEAQAREEAAQEEKRKRGIATLARLNMFKVGDVQQQVTDTKAANKLAAEEKKRRDDAKVARKDGSRKDGGAEAGIFNVFSTSLTKGRM